MARVRKAKASEGGSGMSSRDSVLTCPECGKTFTRPASLGAHRSRAHGVAGASSRSRRGRAGAIRRSGGVQSRRQAASRKATASDGERSDLNRDQLLRTLFPDGVPPREDVIRRANAWLDEAEKLASAR